MTGLTEPDRADEVPGLRVRWYQPDKHHVCLQLYDHHSEGLHELVSEHAQSGAPPLITHRKKELGLPVCKGRHSGLWRLHTHSHIRTRNDLVQRILCLSNYDK